MANACQRVLAHSQCHLRPIGSTRQVFLKAAGHPRFVSVKSTPSITSITAPPIDVSEQTRSIPKLSGKGLFPQTVSFEVLGAPYSLLSVSLPASSVLYTRRGTLLGVSSWEDLKHAVSTLYAMKPFRRSILGIPFLYQNVTSTTALNCLVSTNEPNTTFAIIELDGAVDWMVAQRNGLLAWAGHSLLTRPILNRRMSPAHWSNTLVSGRGLVALCGKGQIYQVVLQENEEMVIHPSNLLAYSVTNKKPQPYRLAQTSLRFQIPKLSVIKSWFPESRFLNVMSRTETYQFIARSLFNIRTWIRQVVWGDRLFVKFRGPSTILVQSRASRIRDVLSKQDVNDIAMTEPGSLQAFYDSKASGVADATQKEEPLTVKMATVQPGGKVEFEDSTAKDFIR